MNKKLHILHLEDSQADAEIIQAKLVKEGLECEITLVGTREDFTNALKQAKFDVILADYSLPSFNGLSALMIAKEQCPDVPFILVSGAVGEEMAIETLKKGATDYVLKGNLSRLVPTVHRALEEAQERVQRKQAEDALRQSEELYRSLFVNMLNGFAYCRMIYDQGRPQDFIYLAVNSTFERLTGLKNVVGKKVSEVIPGIRESNPELFEIYGRVVKTRQPEHFEIYLKSLDMWFSIAVYSPAAEHFVSTFDVITDRKKAVEALKTSETKFSTISNTAADAILLMDNDGKITYWNPSAEKVFGHTSNEAIGKDLHNLLVPTRYHKDFKKGFIKFKETGRGSAIGKTLELSAIRKGGTEFPIDLSVSAAQIEGQWCSVGIVRDITERKRDEDALRVSEAKLYDNYFIHATINMILGESQVNIPLEEILKKSLNMILSNPWIAFEAIGSIFLVEDDADVLVMKAQSNLHEPITKLCMRVPFGKCLCGKAAQSQKFDYSDNIDERHETCYEGMHPHGHYSVPILFSGRTLGVLNVYLEEGHIRDKREEEFLRIVADTLAGIIMRKKAEDRIEYLAYYDTLTDLPNRNLFLERINQEIAGAKDRSNSIAVVITDINKFKSIYDIYGSEVGDRVLKEVAGRLSTTVRKSDIAAHLGNDEFGIACIGITGSDDIIMLEKIIKDISYPLKIAGDEIILTFSTGISLYPHDGENASELLKSAGLALSIAKKEGRKTWQFYTEDMNVMASEIMLLEKQLVTAIKNEEFILHYQPYWDITTKKMVGMEALIRWQSKDKGLVPPGKFIPVLEDTGMIIEVGEWILREAMRQVKEWQDKRYPVVPISVNMSLVQFRQKDLAEMVKRIMGECGFYPSLLTLEITESAFMQDIEFTKSVLTAMKEIGCSVSIDDFGTGYSSLAYLKRLPVDNLKIDISFIREMVKDPDSASIVMAIINMANTLNLKTIAEGIETEEQWNFLRLLRCDMGQGFYLSKPLPAEEMATLIISQG